MSVFTRRPLMLPFTEVNLGGNSHPQSQACNSVQSVVIRA